MTEQTRSWPLFVVTDLSDHEGHFVGQVEVADRWTLYRRSPHEVREAVPDEEIQHLLQIWLDELQAEVDAANGERNDTTPLSAGRMEWRRALHNNNLRIGPGTSHPARAAA